MEQLYDLKTIKVIKNDKIILNLNDISIFEGDQIGIIGANGAGKTTLVKILLNRMDYIGMMDKRIGDKKLGVHLQENNLNDYLKVKELIEICINKEIESISNNKYFLSLKIECIKNKLIKELSGGEKQKLILLLTFIQEPDVLFFDEPTTGLDYETRIEIVDNIKKICSNKTLILVSHYFNEIEMLTKKLLILDEGECLYFGNIDSLLNSFSEYYVYDLTDVNNEEYNKSGLTINVGLKRYLLTNLLLDIPREKMNLEIAYKVLIENKKMGKPIRWGGNEVFNNC